MTPPLFEEVEHTADLTIVVRGRDRGDMFARAGQALYSLMVELEGVEMRESRTVVATGADVADLLHEWLARLLELFACDGFVACTVKILQISPTRVHGELAGETFERGRHVYVREIKAVTYHGLRARSTPDGWEARVTLDV